MKPPKCWGCYEHITCAGSQGGVLVLTQYSLMRTALSLTNLLFPPVINLKSVRGKVNINLLTPQFYYIIPQVFFFHSS